MRTSATFFISLVFILMMKSSYAQWSCADDYIDSLTRSAVPRYDEILQHENQKLNNYIKANHQVQNSQGPGGNGNHTSSATYLIPVVFHVIYPVGQAYGTGTNISYAQIVSQ